VYLKKKKKQKKKGRGKGEGGARAARGKEKGRRPAARPEGEGKKGNGKFNSADKKGKVCHDRVPSCPRSGRLGRKIKEIDLSLIIRNSRGKKKKGEEEFEYPVQ